ncbi:unnamed protein product [Pleuronectes platessa]|uniref:Uncharacterized protein n=1 Tax=Pleuronectes platessa TaxID=8262 RepID=A0A9N7YM48_PLEPL|nr:unnamed protein product [Pleuronectes platessa]
MSVFTLTEPPCVDCSVFSRGGCKSVTLLTTGGASGSAFAPVATTDKLEADRLPERSLLHAEERETRGGRARTSEDERGRARTSEDERGRVRATMATWRVMWCRRNNQINVTVANEAAPMP